MPFHHGIERDKTLVQIFSGGGKSAATVTAFQKVPHGVVFLGRCGIPGSVPSIMADIDRLIAFGGRSNTVWLEGWNIMVASGQGGIVT
jgi:hypothetical protein